MRGLFVDNDSFDQVITRYGSQINSWCYRFTGDRDAASDLTQEVLLRAYRHFHTFRGDSHLCTWLYAIARNHCANATRQHKRLTTPLTDRLAAVLPDDSAGRVYSRIEQDQTARMRVRVLFQRLTPREAEVLWLHYGHETPLDTITQSLGLTNRSGAKAYIVSARRKLQRAMPKAA